MHKISKVSRGERALLSDSFYKRKFLDQDRVLKIDLDKLQFNEDFNNSDNGRCNIDQKVCSASQPTMNCSEEYGVFHRLKYLTEIASRAII